MDGAGVAVSTLRVGLGTTVLLAAALRMVARPLLFPACKALWPVVCKLEWTLSECDAMYAVHADVL